MRVMHVVVICTLLMMSAIEADCADVPRLALYRVELDSIPDLDDDRVGGREFVNFWLMLDLEYIMEHGTVVDMPIFTDDDIIEYVWDRQYIVVTEEAASRYPDFRDIPLESIPALMMVDGAPCYAVRLWNPWSSWGSFLPQLIQLDLDTIWEGRTYAVKQMLMLRRRGYPASEDPRPPDRRMDERVKAIMMDQGKLSYELNESAHTDH